MSNSAPVTAFWAGAILAVVGMSFAQLYLPGSHLKASKALLAECEQHLPRDQHCVLQAVPEEQHE